MLRYLRYMPRYLAGFVQGVSYDLICVLLVTENRLLYMKGHILEELRGKR